MKKMTKPTKRSTPEATERRASIEERKANLAEFRRAKLREIAAQFKDARREQQELATLLTVAPSYLTQLLKGQRNISTEAARQFEKKLNLADGFLDGVSPGRDVEVVMQIMDLLDEASARYEIPLQTTIKKQAVRDLYRQVVARGAKEGASLDDVVKYLLNLKPESQPDADARRKQSIR